MNPIAAAIGISPWRIVAVLLVVAGLLGLGIWCGYTRTRDYYEPKLSAASEQIGKLTAANAAMKASVEQQNAAITTLQAEGQKREQAAKVAAQQARAQAVQYQTRAQSVLMFKPPTGANPCTAAQVAFDDELRTERGAR